VSLTVTFLVTQKSTLKLTAEESYSWNQNNRWLPKVVLHLKHSLVKTVYVSYFFQSNRKSAILTAAKKAKLKSNPSRVRFAEAVTVNGDKIFTHVSIAIKDTLETEKCCP
jgi:3-dehydroquinate dehydratase